MFTEKSTLASVGHQSKYCKKSLKKVNIALKINWVTTFQERDGFFGTSPFIRMPIFLYYKSSVCFESKYLFNFPNCVLKVSGLWVPTWSDGWMTFYYY